MGPVSALETVVEAMRPVSAALENVVEAMGPVLEMESVLEVLGRKPCRAFHHHHPSQHYDQQVMNGDLGLWVMSYSENNKCE